MTKTNTAKQTQTTAPKTKKSIFGLSTKDLKMVHGGKGGIAQ